MAQTTAIAVTEGTVSQYVNDRVPAMVKSYAVRNYDAQVWIRTVKLAIVENPDLMACLETEAGKISLAHALRFAATTGLSLNPQEGKAALVPIDGKVNYWPMKNGLVELALETGKVRNIRMNAVRAQDRFTIKETMDGDSYEFSPNVKTRGEIIGFFCAIKLVEGPSLVEYMTAEEVIAHRDTYGKGIKRAGSAWNTSFEGMGLKTVTKRACNRIKLPAAELPALKAALSDAEPAEFTVTPPARPEKGASAADVEAKLAAVAEKQPNAVDPALKPAIDLVAPPADAPASPAPAGAQGSTEQPEIF